MPRYCDDGVTSIAAAIFKAIHCLKTEAYSAKYWRLFSYSIINSDPQIQDIRFFRDIRDDAKDLQENEVVVLREVSPVGGGPEELVAIRCGVFFVTLEVSNHI